MILTVLIRNNFLIFLILERQQFVFAKTPNKFIFVAPNKIILWEERLNLEKPEK